MNIYRHLWLIIILSLYFHGELFAQEITEKTEEEVVADSLAFFFGRYQSEDIKMVNVKADSFKIDHQKQLIDIWANARLGYQPIRNSTVNQLYDSLRIILPSPVNEYKTRLYTGNHLIDSLIPNFYRTSLIKERQLGEIEYQGNPWVYNSSKPYIPDQGLNNRHIVLWQSHGKYWDNRKEWKWQRPRLFCTSEDKFTQSIVLPFLIPMLQNAGAVVFTPRERDTQTEEIIVDNDGNLAGSGLNSTYRENSTNDNKWMTLSASGFAQRHSTYTNQQNPFENGSARAISTSHKENATAEWIPDIQYEGDYAVYVAYQTVDNSITDASYQVIHQGVTTTFKVNQQMGGGTWVYLGTFHFGKGKNDSNKVMLSNQSRSDGVITADAVRFGGGMGNVVRDKYRSGLPRYLEGARYWAQWAGMPDSIYTEIERKNDYTDDINSRSWMLNYLSGGSIFNPDQEGQKVPFEMSLAIHSDAGMNVGDTIIGTLGIYTTDFNNGLLASGVERMASRDLVDILQTQVVNDIRSKGIEWTRRDMWDRNYSETRIPAPASAIIETLSHQNFGDMIYGHDPHIKFTMARALYKGILRYLSVQHNTKYVVQPLPVQQFAIQFGDNGNSLLLSWEPTQDPLEPTATPQSYIVYTRKGESDFDNGVLVNKTSYSIDIEPDVIYSFKVAALNSGGESFPSEILSALKSSREQHRVLVVNGFHRLSGPAIVNDSVKAGFDLKADPGVPYLYDISLGGYQKDFDRASRNWGDSGDEFEGTKWIGNTFDYSYLHGKAIQTAVLYSFTSCCSNALESGKVNIGNYDVIDLILGLEKNDTNTYIPGKQSYKTFSPKMRQLLTNYLQSGGNLLASGAYIGSDMQNEEEQQFTKQLLKFASPIAYRPESISFNVRGLGKTFSVPSWLNSSSYPVVSADVIQAEEPAFAAMAYTNNNYSAAVAYSGSDYHTFCMGFPLESILNPTDRAAVMTSILQFLVSR